MQEGGNAIIYFLAFQLFTIRQYVAIGNQQTKWSLQNYCFMIIHLVWTGLVLILGFIVPQQLEMPVKGATKSDYNKETFWACPWGKSVVHKGVDIFATKGTPVLVSTYGLVISAGQSNGAGNFLLVLGPKWRLHYYAHLDSHQKLQSNIVHKVPIGWRASPDACPRESCIIPNIIVQHIGKTLL